MDELGGEAGYFDEVLWGNILFWHIALGDLRGSREPPDHLGVVAGDGLDEAAHIVECWDLLLADTGEALLDFEGFGLGTGLVGRGGEVGGRPRRLTLLELFPAGAREHECHFLIIK